MVLFVQVEEAASQSPPSPETYMVDAGFGFCLAHPILLKDHETVPGAALPEIHRLI